MLDLSEGKARRVVGEAWALSLSPDGRTLNTTTHDGRVILWDTSSLKKIGEMETKGSFGTSIACVLSPLNHKSNCSLLIDDTLLLGIKMGEYTFSAQKQTEYSTICRVRNIHLRSNLKGHSSTVRSLSFSPGSNYLAATGDSKVISVYDVQHGEQIANLAGHSSGILSVDWNRTGQLLLTRFLILIPCLLALARWMVVS